MKKIISSAILLFFVQYGLAQVTYYKGEWTVKNKKDLFTCLCKIDFQKDGTVNGEFIWKYISIDGGHAELVEMYKGKINKMGIEFTEGNYYAGTGDIYLETKKLADPDRILGSTKYFIKISADKKALYGTTTNLNGEDPGLIYAVKMNSSAAKEFSGLKSKILSE